MAGDNIWYNRSSVIQAPCVSGVQEEAGIGVWPENTQRLQGSDEYQSSELPTPHLPGEEFNQIWTKSNKDDCVGTIPSLIVPSFNEANDTNMCRSPSYIKQDRFISKSPYIGLSQKPTDGSDEIFTKGIQAYNNDDQQYSIQNEINMPETSYTNPNRFDFKSLHPTNPANNAFSESLHTSRVRSDNIYPRGLSNPHFPGDFDPMWSKNTKDERVGHIPSLFVPTFNLPTMAPNEQNMFETPVVMKQNIIDHRTLSLARPTNMGYSQRGNTPAVKGDDIFTRGCSFPTYSGNSNDDIGNIPLQPSDLKLKTVMKKSQQVLVPDIFKDEKYWMNRNKNNIAAKISREKRRVKLNQITSRVRVLEKVNIKLTNVYKDVEMENKKLKKALDDINVEQNKTK